MNLFPTFEAPEIEVLENVATPEFKNGLYFDFEKGDLRISGSGKIVEANAKEAWLQWCHKAVLTQFGKFLAYGNSYGMDHEYAFSGGSKAENKDAIEQEIKSTLMNDPNHRTVEVSDFQFEWDVDSVRVKCTLIGADGYTGDLDVSLVR